VRLPNHEQANVAREKLLEYLLVLEHSVGGSKAAFLARFGFTRKNWVALQEALLQQARVNEVTDSRTTIHGQYFEIVGRLSTLDGRNPTIRSVWLIDRGSNSPRLITIVPLRRRTDVAGA
jgi:hypothetical protein